MSRTKQKDNFRFYIYAYLRSKDSATAKAGTPYYIGKGQGRRLTSKHGKLNIPPNRQNIIVMERNLSEVGALALERFYIDWYGRKDIKTGILLNLTGGGDGSTNILSTKPKNRIDRKCFNCDTVFSVHPNEKKLSCSKECKNVLKRILKPNKIYYTSCLCCAKDIISGVKTKVYCSLSCKARHHKRKEKVDTKKFKFRNITTKIEHLLTARELMLISGMSRAETNHLTHGTKRIIKGWTIWDSNLLIFRDEIQRKLCPPQIKIICIHCNISAIPGNYNRWHGDKCKLFTNLLN